MIMIKVYGLPNCDTTKAAIKWLKQKKVSYSFHDFRADGVTQTQIHNWLLKVPLEKLLNRKSTAWRELTPEEQSAAETIEGAVALMEKHSNLIKRPLIEWPDGHITVGYKEAQITASLNSSE